MASAALDMDDDDLFFADLSRQISLLINDDDQGPPRLPFHHFVAFKAACSTTMQSNARPCEQCAWNVVESRGTGVFIPKPTNWRKKNKQRRLRSSYDTTANTNNRQQLPDNASSPSASSGRATQARPVKVDEPSRLAS